MCCGAVFAKIFIFIVSVVSLILGLITLGLTLWLFFGFNIMYIAEVFESNELSYSMYGLIGVIVLLLLSGVAGIIGACMKKKPILVVYIVLTIICIVVSVVLGLMWWTYASVVIANAEEEMTTTLEEDYVSEYSKDGVSIAWNVIQYQFKTCGVNDRSEWLNSTWFASLDPVDTRQWPFTCCKDADKQVKIRDVIEGKVDESSFNDLTFVSECYDPLNPKVNTKGSKDELVPSLAISVYIVGGICLGSAVFHLIAVLMAIVMIRDDD